MSDWYERGDWPMGANKPLPDATEGTRETDSHDDPGEASPASDAIGSRPSPGAVCPGQPQMEDPPDTSWVEMAVDGRAMARHRRNAWHVVQALRRKLGVDPRIEAMGSVSNPVIRETILAAADAADKAAGIVRVDTRDEATVELIAKTLWERNERAPWGSYYPDTERLYRDEARRVLAALAGEQ